MIQRLERCVTMTSIHKHEVARYACKLLSTQLREVEIEVEVEVFENKRRVDNLL